YTSADEILNDLEEFRKNPAISFSYFNDAAGHYGNVQATREVPSGAIAKAESTLPKPVRTPVKKAEMTKEEFRSSRKTASKTSTLVAIFLIVAFLAGAVIFIVRILSPIMFPQEKEEIRIPKFIGLKYDDIVANEEWKALYRFTRTDEYNEDAAEGYVFWQSETPDRRVEKKAEPIEISLTVSKGSKPPVTMPFYINQEYREVVTELGLLEMDLKIETEPEPHEDITKDYVIRTVPPMGGELVEGQIVYIIYSTGPKDNTVEVPEVEGKSYEYAISRLESWGFEPVIIHRHDAEVPEGYVITQTPAPGIKAPYKSEVELIVSDGPVEASPSPSPSAPESPDVPASPPVTETITSPSPSSTTTIP
ncbi:MAG: PASTA domain-containing protein, partial [Clostridiales bacterium]|nr:PASTA domain-containing protein [Clostridiales bacterium]